MLLYSELLRIFSFFAFVFNYVNSYTTVSKSLNPIVTSRFFVEKKPSLYTGAWTIDLEVQRNDGMFIETFGMNTQNKYGTFTSFYRKYFNGSAAESTVLFLSPYRIKYHTIDTVIVVNDTAINFTCNNVDDGADRGLGPEGLAFGFDVPHDSFSPTHQMYFENRIAKPKFAFKQLTPKEGRIYFGGVPEEDKEEYIYKGTCEVENKEWGCHMISVVASDNNGKNEFVYDVNNYTFISTFYQDSLVPKAFFNYLINTYYKEYISNGKCKIEHLGWNPHITCECDEWLLGGTFSFKLNGLVFTIPKEKLFYKYGWTSQFCQLLIKEDTKDRWIFGTSILRNYLSVFNYEKGTVVFKSTTPLNIEPVNVKTNIVNYYYLSIGILIPQIILIIAVIRFRKRKAMTSKNKVNKEKVEGNNGNKLFLLIG